MAAKLRMLFQRILLGKTARHGHTVLAKGSGSKGCSQQAPSGCWPALEASSRGSSLHSVFGDDPELSVRSGGLLMMLN